MQRVQTENMAELALVVLTSVVVLAVSVLVVTVVYMPFLVSLTCYRANYTPKAVSLTNEQQEDDAKPLPFFKSIFCAEKTRHLGPNGVDGMFSMWHRIKSIDGWRGLYRGTWLFLAQLLVTAIPTVMFMLQSMPATEVLSKKHKHSSSSPPPPPPSHGWQIPIGTVLLAVFLTFAVQIPLDVLMRRTMVHPVRLNWVHPRTALKHVLTIQEYKQPWRLYLLPGVYTTRLLQIMIMNVFTPLVVLTLMPRLPAYAFGMLAPGLMMNALEAPPVSVGAGQKALFVLWNLAAWVALLPLDNMYVRGVTQRADRLYIALNTSDQANDSGEAPRENASTEPIVSLRPCLGNDDSAWTHFGAAHVEPYTNIVDMFCKMRDEEGNRSLTRGFLYTILGHPMSM